MSVDPTLGSSSQPSSQVDDQRMLQFGQCDTEFTGRETGATTTTCTATTSDAFPKLYDSNDRFLRSLSDIVKDLRGEAGKAVQAWFADKFKLAPFDSFFDIFGLTFLLDLEAKLPELQFTDFAHIDVLQKPRGLYVHCKHFFFLELDNDATLDEMHLHRWTVEPKVGGAGLALAVYGAMLNAARAAGIRAIVADAISSGGANGYYTWVRYGFDGFLNHAGFLAELESAALPQPKTTLEFSFKGSTTERRKAEDTAKYLALWKQHGSTIVTEFLVDPESRSSLIFKEYRDANPFDLGKVLKTYKAGLEKAELDWQKEKEARELAEKEEQEMRRRISEQRAQDAASARQARRQQEQEDETDDEDWK
jgi:hypothetical protein